MLCIKRVENLEKGLVIINNGRFAKDLVIYAQNGCYARKFAHETHGSMWAPGTAR